ncbi:MAG: polyprenyl synthetase family protein [Chloroflexota bacterium]|jgi:octaprenyl-diphosphate synthase
MDISLTQEGVDAVEEILLASIDSEVDLLNEASRHILHSGGKRVRPQVALLSYLAAGGNDQLEAAQMAAAVEMVHTATLVHDDINDHSLVRRGRPSVHARWGRTFALLAGDYLFTKVYQLMAPYGTPYNSIMATACSELVEGETMQAAAAKSGNIDRETYKRIVSLKTASLFEAAARMGGLMGGAEDRVVEGLAEYAYNLGIAFQVIDDILDIIGDPETLGKPVGADVAQGRGAFATENGHTILSLQGGGEAVAEPVATLDETDPIQMMMSKLRNSGAIELARLQAREVAERARNALSIVPPSPARDGLEDLIDLVLDRDR